MALDPVRAALVMQEYRYKNAIVEDASIKARFPDAVMLELDTNLDESTAASLASSLFSITNTQAKIFTLVIEDVLFPEDFTTSPNRYTLSFSRHPVMGSSVYTVMKADIDYGAGLTEITVRA